jgi:2-keto-4-pentenoate hydratase/2-oxohepta-3-ene-1,7-dioic acid hydratase in catechol pathway
MLFARADEQVKILGTTIPVPRVFVDFLGFEKHVKQIREKRGADMPPAWYDHASYYVIDLPPEKLFGPGEEVFIPACTKMADYEFEIGLIITEDALLTSFEDALAFVKRSCLVTIVNDWSARDVQKIDMEGLGPTNSKQIIGKSCGPKIVPAAALKMDEFGVFDMAMRLKVNGQVRCDTNYQTLYHVHPKTNQKAAWSFPRILQFLGQQNIAVHKGYWIGSGTVGDGCIAEFSAKIDPASAAVLKPAVYPWLKDGDQVEMEVDGIGTLASTVRLQQIDKREQTVSTLAAK